MHCKDTILRTQNNWPYSKLIPNSGNILNAGAYAQLQTKLFPGFELTAGLRLDNATYFNKGEFNQTVYDELGLRTDNGLSTFQVQPRLQFTWDINDKHRDIIRAGAGIFASGSYEKSVIYWK